MQQEHELSPSPGHHRGCYGLLDRPWWRRFDQSLGKDRTIKKIPCQVRAQPCGLDLHLNSSLFPWCAGQGAKQAAEPLGTQRLAPCPLQHIPVEGVMLQLCKVHPLPGQEQWGNPQPAREHTSSLASEAPGEQVLCSLATLAEVPASPPQLYTS